MRASLFTFLIVVVSLKVISAEVSIKKIEFTDRVFKGTIDNNYPITIFLAYANDAPDHRFTHSVKGWYWYDNIKERIPLVGVWDGDLTLYQFQTSAQRDSVVNFKSKNTDNWHYWKILEEIKGKKNFLEKFVIQNSHGAEKSSWTNHKSSLSVQIYETDLQVRRTLETLEVVNGKKRYTTEMSQFTKYDRNFKLESFKVEGDELRILIRFDYGSKGHVQTMCGAGSETGFILLTYTLDINELQSIKRELVESCNQGMYTVEKSSVGRADFYNIEVENNNDRRLVIDNEAVTMRSEKWVR